MISLSKLDTTVTLKIHKKALRLRHVCLGVLVEVALSCFVCKLMRSFFTREEVMSIRETTLGSFPNCFVQSVELLDIFVKGAVQLKKKKTQSS